MRPYMAFAVVALQRTAKGGPYRRFVRPYITRSISERKQSNRIVQGKRVYERIVTVVKLTPACLTSCGLCYIMVIDLFNRRMNLCFA